MSKKKKELYEWTLVVKNSDTGQEFPFVAVASAAWEAVDKAETAFGPPHEARIVRAHEVFSFDSDSEEV